MQQYTPRQLAMMCPAGFARLESRGHWKPSKHLLYLDKTLVAVEQGKLKRVIISLPPRHGKALTDDTPILTVNGWKNHGQLRIGDYVFSNTGKPVKVLAVGERIFDSTWKIDFKHGDSIECHSMHEWPIYDEEYYTNRQGVECKLKPYTLKIETKNIRGKYDRLINSQQREFRICGIEQTRIAKPMRCIQVEGGIYLAGKTLIPTHNSLLISQYFPAWYLCRNPNHSIILTSYADRFAAQWGMKVKNAICNIGIPVFGQAVERFESAAADDWRMRGNTGGMLSRGVGGGITGRGANGIIIDDPIANAQEANSKTIRDKIYDWYGSTLLTRLMPDGWQIIVMTRWHEDDLVGRILQEEDKTNRWKYIKMPAIATQSDAKTARQEGDALWPEMWPLKKLLEIRNSPGMSSYWWNALYQQSPSAPEGSIFKHTTFKYCDVYDTFIVLRGTANTVEKRHSIASLKFFQVIDTAMKVKSQNDYTVIGTFAMTPERDLVVWDIFRQRLEVPDQWGAIKNAKAKYPQVIFQAIEDKQSGTGLIQTAKREGKPLLPINPHLGKRARAADNLELRATNDKIQLATPVSIAYENGSVYHRLGAGWLSDFETELTQFDKGAHDDQVDVLAYAWMLTQNSSYFRESQPIDLDYIDSRKQAELDKISDPILRSYVNIADEDVEESDPRERIKTRRRK
jgi:predicted phage terminase large subunit-like protein